MTTTSLIDFVNAQIDKLREGYEQQEEPISQADTSRLVQLVRVQQTLLGRTTPELLPHTNEERLSDEQILKILMETSGAE